MPHRVHPVGPRDVGQPGLGERRLPDHVVEQAPIPRLPVRPGDQQLDGDVPSARLAPRQRHRGWLELVPVRTASSSPTTPSSSWTARPPSPPPPSTPAPRRHPRRRHRPRAARPGRRLRTVVRNAIATTADKLDLVPGDSPSSTVSIVRVGPELVDVFVLGDSPVIVGFRDGTQQRICDDRLAQLNFPARDAYRARLAAGHGYDDEHHRLLAELQQQQRAVRNKLGGYWIAEATPEAANEGIKFRAAWREIIWCIIGTDGTEKPLRGAALTDWSSITSSSVPDLRSLLQRLHRWEASTASTATRLGAKTHDDKSVVAAELYPDLPWSVDG